MGTKDLAIYFVDVGQGDATVIFPPRDDPDPIDPIVFDCADSGVVEKLLEVWSCKKVSSLVLSHLDADHIAGALQLLQCKSIEIARARANLDRSVPALGKGKGKKTRGKKGSKGAKDLLDELERRDLSGKTELLAAMRDPSPIASGPTGNWSVRLLAPRHRQAVQASRRGRWKAANTYSSVLRIEMGGTAVLVGGDAPLLTWSQIPQAERRAQVFRTPHHGGALEDGGRPARWNVDRLYHEAGPPDGAVVSVGTQNRHRHPDPRWIKPLMRGNCNLLCTQVTERCQLGIKTERGDAEAFLDQVIQNAFLVEPDWRVERDRRRAAATISVPCAGTVLVTISPDGKWRIRPTSERHKRNVDLWKTPLCRPR